MRLSPAKDEDLGNLNVVHKLILPQRKESEETREDVREANGGIPLLTDLCLAMRSDPVGMIRGLGEVVTCVYGPAVTCSFPDPLWQRTDIR